MMILNENTFTMGQHIVWIVFLVELFLITLLVVESYVAKIWSLVTHKKQKRKIQAIRAYFENKNMTMPPPYLADLSLLFSELRRTTALSEDEKRSFVQRYVAPYTKDFARTRNYQKRFFLLESFSYYITPEDAPVILRLIQDERSIISINAVTVGIRLVDALIYQAIIERLSNLDWATQKLYITHLSKSDVLFDILKSNLTHSKSNWLKSLCYDIAYHCGSREDLFSLAEKDIDSTNRECQLAAIRVLAQSSPEKAQPKLLELIKSSDWLVRNAVIQALIQNHAPGVIHELANHLDDANYWVRVNSTIGISNISGEDSSFVKNYLVATDAHPQPLASYFLDTKRMKEHL